METTMARSRVCQPEKSKPPWTNNRNNYTIRFDLYSFETFQHDRFQNQHVLLPAMHQKIENNLQNSETKKHA